MKIKKALLCFIAVFYCSVYRGDVPLDAVPKREHRQMRFVSLFWKSYDQYCSYPIL